MHKAFTHFADERRGEWFKMDRIKAINIFNVHAMNELSKELQNEQEYCWLITSAGYKAFSRADKRDTQRYGKVSGANPMKKNTTPYREWQRGMGGCVL